MLELYFPASQFSHAFDPTTPLNVPASQAPHDPPLIYEDVATRTAVLVPKVDVYTAGFPYQPWSGEGKRQGRRDKARRGRVFDHVAGYIDARKP